MILLKSRYQKFIDKEARKSRILYEILRVLTEKPYSIAELCRKMRMNRSTLRYHLLDLKSDNRIVLKRVEDEKGRPTMISLNKERFVQEEVVLRRKGEE